MKKKIAHRGNVYGPNLYEENSILAISHSISLGYDVEIDIRLINNKLILGHDEPKNEVDFNFISSFSDNLWFHCKNYEALNVLVPLGFNCFFHTDDEYVMTSNGYIFTRPGGEIGNNSVMVMPEMVDCYTKEDLAICYAVCSDYVGNIDRVIGGKE